MLRLMIQVSSPSGELCLLWFPRDANKEEILGIFQIKTGLSLIVQSVTKFSSNCIVSKYFKSKTLSLKKPWKQENRLCRLKICLNKQWNLYSYKSILGYSHTFNFSLSSCINCCPSMFIAVNSVIYCSMFIPINQWHTCWVVHSEIGLLCHWFCFPVVVNSSSNA